MEHLQLLNERAQALAKAFEELNKSFYEHNAEETDEILGLIHSIYPFDASFDEMNAGVQDWALSVNNDCASMISKRSWSGAKVIRQKADFNELSYDLYENDNNIQYGWIYPDEVVIGIRHDGQYSLLLDRTEYVSKDLNELERKVWNEVSCDINTNYK